MAGRQLPTIWTRWPGVTRKIAAWQSYIERMDKWTWGPGFDVHDRDGGRAVFYQPPPSALSAVVTTAITAAPNANAVGQGVAKLRVRTGTAVADGEAGLVVYNDFAAAVAVGKRIVIARDPSGDYMLVSGDCP